MALHVVWLVGRDPSTALGHPWHDTVLDACAGASERCAAVLDAMDVPVDDRPSPARVAQAVAIVIADEVGTEAFPREGDDPLHDGIARRACRMVATSVDVGPAAFVRDDDEAVSTLEGRMRTMDGTRADLLRAATSGSPSSLRKARDATSEPSRRAPSP